ncbi:microtubule-associated protein futsch isoform X2 [Aplysia californica]|uniref:Microtubule-associated protein futsch isoform X2 n=1 Tax=Aplysia californica TaxID=6500 RepID=A0ABM1VW68_APLCA|nr:microtubule-associated protein futsch isoform X2 [Aplysia californica]
MDRSNSGQLRGSCVDPGRESLSSGEITPLTDACYFEEASASEKCSRRSTPLTPQEFDLLSDSNPFKQDIAEKYGLGYPGITTRSQGQNGGGRSSRGSRGSRGSLFDSQLSPELKKDVITPISQNVSPISAEGREVSSFLGFEDDFSAIALRKGEGETGADVVSGKEKKLVNKFDYVSEREDSSSAVWPGKEKSEEHVDRDVPAATGPLRPFLQHQLHLEISKDETGDERVRHGKVGQTEKPGEARGVPKLIREQSIDKGEEAARAHLTKVKAVTQSSWILESKEELNRSPPGISCDRDNTSQTSEGWRGKSDVDDSSNDDPYCAIRSEDLQRRHGYSKFDLSRKAWSDGQYSHTSGGNTDVDASLDIHKLSTQSFEVAELAQRSKENISEKHQAEDNDWARAGRDADGGGRRDGGLKLINSETFDVEESNLHDKSTKERSREKLGSDNPEANPFSDFLNSKQAPCEDVSEIKPINNDVTPEWHRTVRVQTQASSDSISLNKSPEANPKPWSSANESVDICQKEEALSSGPNTEDNNWDEIKPSLNINVTQGNLPREEKGLEEEDTLKSSFYKVFSATVEDMEEGENKGFKDDGEDHTTTDADSNHSVAIDSIESDISKDILFQVKMNGDGTDADTSSISRESMKVNLSQESSSTDQQDDLTSCDLLPGSGLTTCGQLRAFDLMVPLDPLTESISAESIVVNVSNESLNSTYSGKSNQENQTKHPGKPTRSNLSIDLRRRNMLDPSRRSSLPLDTQGQSSGRPKLPLVSTHSLDMNSDPGRRLSLNNDIPTTEEITTFKTSQTKLAFEGSSQSSLSTFKSFGRTNPPPGDQRQETPSSAADQNAKRSNLERQPIESCDSTKNADALPKTAALLESSVKLPATSSSNTQKRANTSFADLALQLTQKPKTGSNAVGTEPPVPGASTDVLKTKPGSQFVKTVLAAAAAAAAASNEKRIDDEEKSKETSDVLKDDGSLPEPEQHSVGYPPSKGFDEDSKDPALTANISEPPDIVPNEVTYSEPQKPATAAKSEKLPMPRSVSEVLERMQHEEGNVFMTHDYEEMNFMTEHQGPSDESKPSEKDDAIGKSTVDRNVNSGVSEDLNKDKSEETLETRGARGDSTDSDGGDIDSIVNEFKQQGSSDEGDIDELVKEFKDTEPQTGDGEGQDNKPQRHGIAFTKFGKVLKKMQTVTKYMSKPKGDLQKEGATDNVREAPESRRGSVFRPRAHSQDHTFLTERSQTAPESDPDNAFDLLSKAAEVFKEQTVKKKAKPVFPFRRTRTEAEPHLEDDNDEDTEEYDLVSKAAKLFKGYKLKKSTEESSSSDRTDSKDGSGEKPDSAVTGVTSVEAPVEAVEDTSNQIIQSQAMTGEQPVCNVECPNGEHVNTTEVDGKVPQLSSPETEQPSDSRLDKSEIQTSILNSELLKEACVEMPVINLQGDEIQSKPNGEEDVRRNYYEENPEMAASGEDFTTETKQMFSISDSGCGSELDNMSTATDNMASEVEHTSDMARSDAMSEVHEEGGDDLYQINERPVEPTGLSEPPEQSMREEDFPVKSDTVIENLCSRTVDEAAAETHASKNETDNDRGDVSKSPETVGKCADKPCDLVLSTGYENGKTAREEQPAATRSAGGTFVKDDREKTQEKLEEIALELSAVEKAGYAEASAKAKAETGSETRSDYVRLSSDLTETTDAQSLMVNFPDSPDNGMSLDGDNPFSLCCGRNLKKVHLNCTAMMKKPERRPSAVIIANKRCVMTDEERLGVFPALPKQKGEEQPATSDDMTRNEVVQSSDRETEPRRLSVKDHERNRNFAGSREELVEREKNVDGKDSPVVYQDKEKQQNNGKGESKEDTKRERKTRVEKRRSMIDEHEADKESVNIYDTVLNELAVKQGRTSTCSDDSTSDIPAKESEAKMKRYGRIMSESDIDPTLGQAIETAKNAKEEEGGKGSTSPTETCKEVGKEISKVVDIEDPSVNTPDTQESPPYDTVPNALMQESMDTYDNFYPSTAPPVPERKYRLRSDSQPPASPLHPTITTSSLDSIVSDSATYLYSQTQSRRHPSGSKWVSSTPHLPTTEMADRGTPRTGSFPCLPRTEAEASSRYQAHHATSTTSLGSDSINWGNYAKIDDVNDRASYDSESSTSGLVIPGAGRASTLSDVSDAYIFGEYSTVKDDVSLTGERGGVIKPLDRQHQSREQAFRFRHFPAATEESHYVNVSAVTSQPVSSGHVLLGANNDVRRETAAGFEHYATIDHPPGDVMQSKSVQFPTPPMPGRVIKVNCASQTSTESLPGLVRDDASDILEGLPVFEYTLGAGQSGYGTLDRDVVDARGYGQYPDTHRPDLTRQTSSLDRRYRAHSGSSVERDTPRKKPTRVTFSRDEVLTEVIQGIQQSETAVEGDNTVPADGRGLRDMATSTLSSLGGGVKEIARIFHVPFQCCTRKKVKQPKVREATRC